MSTAPAPTDRRSGPPLWLVEGLDIVESRRRVVLGVAGLIIVVGLLVALLAPNVLPPTPLVGAAVALAALLIGVAAAIVVDSSDLRVRGPRHVVAAGGELVAVLPVAVDQEAADDLAAVVLEAREPDRSMLLGLAASSLDIAATLRWTDALGVALARRGVSVLRVDLASGRSDTPGLAEVAAGERRLTEVVDYETGVLLARLGAGGDHREALSALVDLPAKLPRDLEVLLVALPIAASRGVVQAARGLDHVLVVAERGDTSRVDLIAGLDALRAADLQAQVILLDDLTAERIAGGGTAAEVVPVRTRLETDTDPDSTEVVGEPAGEAPTDGATPASATETEALAPTPEEPVGEAGPITEGEPATDEPAAVDEPAGADEPAAADGSAEAAATEVMTPPAEDVDATEVLDEQPAGAASDTASPQDETTRLSEPAVIGDDEPDAEGPPPPPAIAYAADVPTDGAGEPTDATERLEAVAEQEDVAEQAADGTEQAADVPDQPVDVAEQPEPPADADDPASRVAAIVRAVVREHDQPAERSTPRP
jgi:hypothetical protein